MPRQPHPDQPQPRWPRRRVLRAALGTAVAVGAGGALGGCDLFRSPPPPDPDPLEPLLAGTRALLTRYDAALARHPDLTDRLGPLRANHSAHVAALLDLIGRPELFTPSPVDGVWADPPGEPGAPDQAVEVLREAESFGQEAAAQACLAAPAPRAAVLGSIAAARATHVAVLA